MNLPHHPKQRAAEFVPMPSRTQLPWAIESQYFVAAAVASSRPRASVENRLANVQGHRARSFSITFPFLAPDRSERRSLPCRRPQYSGLLSLLFTLFTLFILPTLASAQELPRNAPLTKYSALWTNSPFTSRPIVQAPEAQPETNPLEDYTLIGVSPSAEGFRVTLLNRNDPTERIVIDSGRPNPRHDFKVLDIDRKPGRPLATTVKLSMGSSIGTVGFENALLTLTPPPAAAPPQNPLPPNVNPADGQQEQPPGARRVPRPRIVPPSTPPQPQGGQPGAAQGASNPGGTQGGSRERSDRRSRR